MPITQDDLDKIVKTLNDTVRSFRTLSDTMTKLGEITMTTKRKPLAERIDELFDAERLPYRVVRCDGSGHLVLQIRDANDIFVIEEDVSGDSPEEVAESEQNLFLLVDAINYLPDLLNELDAAQVEAAALRDQVASLEAEKAERMAEVKPTVWGGGGYVTVTGPITFSTASTYSPSVYPRSELRNVDISKGAMNGYYFSDNHHDHVHKSMKAKEPEDTE